jgi:methionine biosynthesis protein MetW
MALLGHRIMLAAASLPAGPVPSCRLKRQREVRRLGVLRKVLAGLRRIFSAPHPRLGELDYDDYWANRPVDDLHPRMKLIAELVPTGAHVMDIGCGDGSLLLHLAATKQSIGFGVDISQFAIEHARARGVDSEVADVTDASFRVRPGTEIVIISEVLEHIADPEAVLVRLRESGIQRIIVTVPNTGYLEHRLRLLFGRFPVQWLLHPGEHVRFWTVADFQGTAKATGFAVRRVIPALGWFPFARWRPSLFASQLIYLLDAVDC